MTVGYSTLEVIPSVKGLARNLERQTSGDLAAAGKKGGKRFGDAAGAEAASGFKSSLGSKLKGFNPLAGLALGAGAVTLFKGAIDGASDLAESTSKANVVFGDASESVLKFGADASESLGQSEAQALSAAGTFGNLLRSVGLSEEASAKFSTTMVTLASDLASFNNTDINTALEALRSGLVGETEPLKAFGVNMNEAVLKTKALELGLSDGKAVLDANAKAQAAYAVIMEQTTLAQGDFARTSEGLANQSKTLGAQWSELTTELGQELLPATTAFVGFLNDEGLPAMGAAGGAAKDLGQAVAALPSPVLAAAAAFAVLKVSAATGLTGQVAGAATRTGSAVESLRLRAMLAADAYRQATTQQTVWATNTASRVIPAASRTAGAMAALRAASIGAGAGIRSGLGKASALVGGPWGAALILGTGLLTKFYTEHKKAEQRVDELTASLDKQTGALTENSREKIFAALQDSGAIDAAKRFGISLRDVQLAAEGNQGAIRRVNAELDALQAAQRGTSDSSNGMINDTTRLGAALGLIRGAIGGQNDELAEGRRRLDEAGEALGRGAKATEGATVAARDYGAELKETRGALQKLADAEAERALNAIQQRRDQIALRETLRAAKEEARDGKRVLDGGTRAADANMQALLDLADQWNTSGPKVRNAKGAYVDMRDEFFNVARQMGATKDRALELTDELLRVPKKAALEFQSKGFKERMAEIRALRREERRAFTFSVAYVNSKLAPGKTLAGYADGGRIGGVGSGTSDSNLALVSRGEWVIRERAASHYGDDFMRRLNAMQLPKFANGGPVAAAPSRPSGGGGVTITGGITVYADTYDDILRKASVKVGQSMSDNVRFGGVR